MKRLTVILLAGLLSLSLMACASPEPAEPDPTAASEPMAAVEPAETAEPAAPAEPEASAQPAAAPAGGGNILIAYFTAAENSEVDAVSSASVVAIDGAPKGNVQAVAEMIQGETAGELFSIQTSVEYPGDIGELIDYAAVEQDENVRPELTTHIENLGDYDVIFIGYPNWWYDMPMVMYSFFEEYDFGGKTIIPFNVHNGSRFSSTIETIQELEPEATVITDGFTVSQRNVADCAADVAAWLDGLGY